MNLNYEEFKEQVISHLEKRLDEMNAACENDKNMHAGTGTVMKLNGQKLDSIYIVRDDQEYYRTLYLNHLYEMYLEGVSLDEIISILIKTGTVDLDDEERGLEIMTDYNKSKDKICLKLVNYERNSEMLKGCPHVRFLDLAIVFYVGIDTWGGYYQATISNELFSQWNIKKKELIKIASHNTKTLNPPAVLGVRDILAQLELPEDISENVCEGKTPEMLSISSSSGRNGAIYMMDVAVLSGCADDVGDDLMIIPSSIHEIIAIPYSSTTREAVDDIIKQVNQTVLDEGDYLSDHAYVFSRKEKIVSM